MNQPELTKKQRKHLKALAHGLKPVVRIGQHGLTDAVVRELEIALDHHELVKVKVAADDRDDRSKTGDAMLSRTGASLVQSIGGMLVLFRRNAQKPVVELPSG